MNADRFSLFSSGGIMLAIVVVASGCAMDVVRVPTTFTTTEARSSKHYVATTAVSLRLDSGYSRTIGGGTEFVDIGLTEKGRVLKPVDTVFTVEGKHVHEAYPVVNGELVVGFYLPVEKSFVSLSHPEKLELSELEKKN